jgi:hypothetical protein
MKTYYRKGKNVFSRKGRKNVKKNGRRTYRRGGSPGLDKLGYGWEGSNIATWPGVQGNADSITRSNHLMVSPYGIPVGGVELPYSTSGDSTQNAYMGGKKRTRKHRGRAYKGRTYKSRAYKGRAYKSRAYKSRAYKSRTHRGGYSYNPSPRNTSKKSVKKRHHKQRGGIFFQDVRNFGRYLANGVKTRINGVRGIEAPVGVMPTDQPYLDRNVDVIVSDPVDVEKIYLDNSNEVAKI